MYVNRLGFTLQAEVKLRVETDQCTARPQSWGTLDLRTHMCVQNTTAIVKTLIILQTRSAYHTTGLENSVVIRPLSEDPSLYRERRRQKAEGNLNQAGKATILYPAGLTSQQPQQTGFLVSSVECAASSRATGLTDIRGHQYEGQSLLSDPLEEGQSTAVGEGIEERPQPSHQPQQRPVC